MSLDYLKRGKKKKFRYCISSVFKRATGRSTSINSPLIYVLTIFFSSTCLIIYWFDLLIFRFHRQMSVCTQLHCIYYERYVSGSYNRTSLANTKQIWTSFIVFLVRRFMALVNCLCDCACWYSVFECKCIDSLYSEARTRERDTLCVSLMNVAPLSHFSLKRACFAKRNQYT